MVTMVTMVWKTGNWTDCGWGGQVSMDAGVGKEESIACGLGGLVSIGADVKWGK